jgi:hypothetical protein
VTFAEVERAVRKLEPRITETGDRILRVYCPAGHKVGWTKVSRKSGSGKDVGRTIAAAIPNQLGITRLLFREIADCSKSRPEYLVATYHEGCVTP